jgi:hypothetical protein
MKEEEEKERVILAILTKERVSFICPLLGNPLVLTFPFSSLHAPSLFDCYSL